MGYVLNVLILTFVISGVFSKVLHLKENNHSRGKEDKQIDTYFNVYNQDLNEIDLTKVNGREANWWGLTDDTYHHNRVRGNEAYWWGLTDDEYHHARDRFARHVKVPTEKSLKGLLKKARNGKHNGRMSVINKVVQKLKKGFNSKRKQVKTRKPRRKSKKHTKTTVKNKTSTI